MSSTLTDERGGFVSDSIVLTIPAEERYRGVATLVVGGVGTRIELPYERSDDLQLAVLSVLDSSDGGTVTLEIDADARDVSLAIGPVRRGSASDQGLLRVLSPLVDDVAAEPRGAEEWVRLRLGRGTA